jgi:hypothetical protein
MRYAVMTSGYYQCPEFSTLEEARKVLAEFVANSLADCRARFGQAAKIKNGEDNYTIRIGGAQGFNVWATHWIQSL